MPRRSRSHLDWQSEAQRSGLRFSLPEGDSERVDDTAESEDEATNKDGSTPHETVDAAELYSNPALFACILEAKLAVRYFERARCVANKTWSSFVSEDL